MGKLYTLDNKLLTETPEIRIGEKVYGLDNRQKTVSKVQNLMNGMNAENQEEKMQEVLSLAFGAKEGEEIDKMNMRYPAYQQLFVLVVAAMTGEEPETVSGSFRQTEKV